MHKLKTNDFDQKIRERLESGAPTVPPNLWEKISGELDTISSKPIETKKQVSILKLLTWSSIAALFCIAVVLGTLWKSHDPVEIQKGPTLAISTNKKEMVEKPIPVEAQSNTVENTRVRSLPITDNTSNNFTALTTMEHSAITSETSRDTLLINPPMELQYALEHKVDVSELERADTFLALGATEVPEVKLAFKSPTEERANTIEGLNVSTLLNFVVSRVDKREQKFIKFSNDEEGSIRLDLNILASRK